MKEPYWSKEQLTSNEAFAIAKSRIWEQWDDDEVVRRQIFQKKCIMNVTRFTQALSNVLGREVYMHEIGLAYRDLQDEYLGLKGSPSIQEIMDLVPDKLIIDCTKN